jgi:quercetin dioxygenase-like cupin family protein
VERTPSDQEKRQFQVDRVSNDVYFVLGVYIEFLLAPNPASKQQSVLRCEMPGGTVVPLHSHQDMEIFYLLSGAMEVYQEGQGWKPVRTGEVIAVEGNVKHALRNNLSESAVSIAITDAQLYYFFRELGVRAGQPIPNSTEQIQKLLGTAERYEYWLGSPQENAQIGLSLE